MPLFGYLSGLVTPAMMTVCINKSSSNFLLSLYLITAGKTRHRNGSVSCEYPDIPENEGNTAGTNPVQFSACRSFRRIKKGRAGTVCQRSARKGRAGIFQKHTHLSIQNSCAPLTHRESSPKLRTPKGAAEKFRGYTDSVGFRLGIVGFLYGQSSLQKPRLCGIMEAQTSREVSYHGERMFSDCGNKMRGSSRA